MTLKKKFTMDTSIFQSYYLMTHFLRSWVQLNFPCISNSVLLLSPVSSQSPGNSSLYLFLPWVQILHPTVTVRIQTTPECTGRIVNVCLGSDQESLGFYLLPLM